MYGLFVMKRVSYGRLKTGTVTPLLNCWLKLNCRVQVRVLVRRALLVHLRDIGDEVELRLVGREPAECRAARLHVLVAEVVHDAAVLGADVLRAELAVQVDRRGRRQRQRNAERRVRGARQDAGAAAAEAPGAVHAFVVEDVEVAVGLLRRRREARVHLVGHERDVVRAAQVDAVVAAEFHLDVARVVALGLARDEPDRAADRVLAEQRALRTAQDLDALEVEQIQDRALRTAVIDVVDVDRHARLERQRVVAEADAADERRGGRAPARAERLDDRVRRERVDHRDVGEVARLEVLARERGDRERRLLEVLLAETRGDDDFLEPSLLLRHDGSAESERAGCKAQAGTATLEASISWVGRHAGPLF